MPGANLRFTSGDVSEAWAQILASANGGDVWVMGGGELVGQFIDTGVLDESFTWSDGTTSKRVWTLKLQPDGSFRGRADDVIGEAVGEVAGNALRWRYVLALPVDDKIYHVDFDDWMFLMDDKVMLNRSYMSKWGFNLGEVTLTFVKRQGQP